MRGSEFALYSIDLLHYNLQEINLKGSPKWLKNKKATINPINNDDKCFQYAITIALNYQKKKKKKEPQKISKVKPFIDQQNWKEKDFSSQNKGWNNFELNNKSITLNVLYVPYNTERIKHVYKSKKI